MDVNCIKFIHVNIADRVVLHWQIIPGCVYLQVHLISISDIGGEPWIQSTLNICILVGRSFEIHQPPEHLV